MSIEAAIKNYETGKASKATTIAALSAVTYKKKTPLPRAQSAAWVEVEYRDDAQAGTWDEVRNAYDEGRIPRDVFYAILEKAIKK